MKNISSIIKNALNEAYQEQENYMFFSNLKQIKRQCQMLLELDPEVVDNILQNGHDWADDHVTEAKTNMDQVFDFMMNEVRKQESYIEYEDLNEGKKKTGTKLCARGKAAAKSKFKVYPSAYANGYAVQVCKGKIKGLDGKKQCSGSYC
jgi:peroxiredoxin family protein